MPKDIIVIGASAGGLEALRVLAAGLPAELAASVFVVLHTSAESPGMLAVILDEGIEESLWSAIRSVEEKVLLMRHLAEHVRASEDGPAAEQFVRAAEAAQRRADLVRQAVIDVKEQAAGSAL